MYNVFLLLFEDTSVLDGIEGVRAVCYAATRVLVGDTGANCSASVDLDSYAPSPLPGQPRSLDYISLRVSTPNPTHNPTTWLEATRADFDKALREAGFYSASPPSARLTSLEYQRTFQAEIYVLLFFIVFLTLTLLYRRRGEEQAPAGGNRYSALNQWNG
jgi:hypothetical protein